MSLGTVCTCLYNLRMVGDCFLLGLPHEVNCKPPNNKENWFIPGKNNGDKTPDIFSFWGCCTMNHSQNHSRKCSLGNDRYLPYTSSKCQDYIRAYATNFYGFIMLFFLLVCLYFKIFRVLKFPWFLVSTEQYSHVKNRTSCSTRKRMEALKLWYLGAPFRAMPGAQGPREEI